MERRTRTNVAIAESRVIREAHFWAIDFGVAAKGVATSANVRKSTGVREGGRSRARG